MSDDKIIEFDLTNKVSTVEKLREVMDGFYKINSDFFFNVPIYSVGMKIFIIYHPEFERELRRKFNEFTMSNYNFSLDN